MEAQEQEPDVCPHCCGTGRIRLDSLATRVCHLRAKKGVSLRQIPGISSAFFSQLETGMNTNPSADKLIVIADFFGVSVDWLLGRSASR